MAFAKVIRWTRPGDQTLKKPEKLDDVKTSVSNAVKWLSNAGEARGS
jgi:hypothetical protein